MAELAPHNLTSNWSNLTYYPAASSQFSGSFAPWRAFDNSSGTYWLGTGSGVDWLRLDLGIGAAGTLTSYKITVNTIPEANRAPKDFKLQGSNDASSWTDLDTQTGQTGWTSGEQRTFTLGGTPGSYRYYRVNITANNGDANYTQIAELHLIGTLDSAQTADVAPHNMTSNTAPSPYVAAASSSFSTDLPWKAFDGIVGGSTDGWMGTGSGVDWISLDLGSGVSKILHGYAVASTDETNRAVKDWTMEGSNNGSSWTTLDTRTSQTGWVSGEKRTYTCSSPTTGYRYFRLNITANNGDATYTQVAELYLYAIDAVVTLTPAAGTITYTGGTPTVILDYVTIAPATGVISYAGGVPVVSLSGVIDLAPAAGSIAYTGGTPTAELVITVAPASGVITYTPGVPVVSFSGTITLSPAAGTITYTGATPTVAVALLIAPSAGTITYTGATPTVTKSIELAPSAGQIVYASGRPALSFVRTAASGDRLYIGDTEYNSLKVTTFKIERTLNGGVSASFEMEYSGGSKPAQREEVAFFVDSIKRFGGMVNAVSERSKPGIETESILTVSCLGFQSYLERVIVGKLYTLFFAGVAWITIHSIWNDYLRELGITYTFEGDPAITIWEQLFHYITAAEAMRTVTSKTPGYNAWIDDNKALHYRQTAGGSANAPFALNRSLPNCDSFNLTKTGKRFANRVWVLPAADIKALWVDTATGDGLNFVFPTTYNQHVKPLVFVDDVEQLVGVQGALGATPGWQCYYVADGIGIFFAAAPANGAEIEFRYPSPFPLAVKAEDLASIAAVGPYEYVHHSRDITDAVTAQLLADALLEARLSSGSDQVIEFRYNSAKQAAWLTEGMVISVVWTFPDVTGNFVVEQVVSEVTGQPYHMWRHTVSLRLGQSDMVEQQLLEKYRQRMPILSPAQHVELELDIDGVGVEVGELLNRTEMQEDGVFSFWSALPNPDDPPEGADIVVDCFLIPGGVGTGESIFPTESPVTDAKKIRFLDGQTTANHGFEFREVNLEFQKGDVLRWEVLQVGSTNPGKYGSIQLGIKQKPATH